MPRRDITSCGPTSGKSRVSTRCYASWKTPHCTRVRKVRRFNSQFCCLRCHRKNRPESKEPGLATGLSRYRRSVRSDRIVHLEFDRMRRVLERVDFLHLELDVAVDEVVREDATLLEEGAIVIEAFQRLTE